MELGEAGRKIVRIIKPKKEVSSAKLKPERKFDTFADFADFANRNSDKVVVETTEKETLYEVGLNVKKKRDVLKEFAVEFRGVKVKDDDSREETVCRISIPCGAIELDKSFSVFDSPETDISSEIDTLRLKCFAVLDHRRKLIDEDKRGETIFFGKKLHEDTYNALRTTVKTLGISPVL